MKFKLPPLNPGQKVSFVYENAIHYGVVVGHVGNYVVVNFEGVNDIWVRSYLTPIYDIPAVPDDGQAGQAFGQAENP